MKYRKLGKSDLEVSEVSFGCMSLQGHARKDSSILLKAYENEINYFDTADLYQKGENEKSVGTVLKPIRQQIFLATKVGNQWRKNGSGWDWNPSKAYILKAVEESLGRLQTDYIDLYQLHGGTIDDPIDETIEAFELLKEQGKIRYYGISSIRPNVIKEYLAKSNIVSNMMQFSLLDRRPEPYFELLEKNQVSVLARGSLAKGLLVGKPSQSHLNYNQTEVEKAVKSIKSISNNERSKTHTALKFILNHNILASTVVGIRTEEQLDAILGVSENSDLTQQEIEILKNSIPTNQYESHL